MYIIYIHIYIYTYVCRATSPDCNDHVITIIIVYPYGPYVAFEFFSGTKYSCMEMANSWIEKICGKKNMQKHVYEGTHVNGHSRRYCSPLGNAVSWHCTARFIQRPKMWSRQAAVITVQFSGLEASHTWNHRNHVFGYNIIVERQ